MAVNELSSVYLPLMEEALTEIDLPALVAEYSTLLFRVAYSVLRNRAEAEDVVQDAFVRVWLHRSHLPVVRDMRLWLVRIVWNLALDRKRRKRPEPLDRSFAHALVDGTIAVDVALESEQRLQNVFREIERLPKGERDVLLLSALQELSTLELARILKRSESAVRALLSRARARLRERLKEGEGS